MKPRAFSSLCFAQSTPRKPTVRIREDLFVALTLHAMEMGLPTRKVFELAVAGVPDARKRP